MRMFANSTPRMYVSAPQPVLETAASKEQGRDRTVPWIPQIPCPTTMAERWASYVLRACKAERDPRTLGLWAHQVGVSYTTLSESCRLIGIAPRHARDFARVLRIIVTPSLDSYQLACFLDISDRRTLDCILQKAGLGQHAALAQDLSVVCFLDNQRFVALENTGLRVLRHVFAPK
jgi:hypothetical protein